MSRIQRRAYAEMLGPTVGDRLHLADTDLIIEVEQDLTLRATRGAYLPTFGNTVYHSLQTKFEQRLWHGLTTIVSHTWSKNIGDIAPSSMPPVASATRCEEIRLSSISSTRITCARCGISSVMPSSAIE